MRSKWELFTTRLALRSIRECRTRTRCRGRAQQLGTTRTSRWQNPSSQRRVPTRNANPISPLLLLGFGVSDDSTVRAGPSVGFSSSERARRDSRVIRQAEQSERRCARLGGSEVFVERRRGNVARRGQCRRLHPSGCHEAHRAASQVICASVKRGGSDKTEMRASVVRSDLGIRRLR